MKTPQAGPWLKDTPHRSRVKTDQGSSHQSARANRSGVRKPDSQTTGAGHHPPRPDLPSPNISSRQGQRTRSDQKAPAPWSGSSRPKTSLRNYQKNPLIRSDTTDPIDTGE